MSIPVLISDFHAELRVRAAEETIVEGSKVTANFMIFANPKPSTGNFFVVCAKRIAGREEHQSVPIVDANLTPLSKFRYNVSIAFKPTATGICKINFKTKMLNKTAHVVNITVRECHH